MNIHKHARLTPLRPAEMARSVLKKEMTLTEASFAFRISQRSVFKWVSRYKRQGHAGMCDRSSRPFSSPRRTAKLIEQAIIRLILPHNLIPEKSNTFWGYNFYLTHNPIPKPLHAFGDYGF